jgi:hypothetical protein
MVFTTQQLAIRRQLQGRRTLTSIHDTAMAWTGLGSAFLAVWRQFAIVATLRNVLIATLYLSSIAAFHITTPALFSLQTFNTSSLIEISTRGLADYQAVADVYVFCQTV